MVLEGVAAFYFILFNTLPLVDSDEIEVFVFINHIVLIFRCLIWNLSILTFSGNYLINIHYLFSL